MVVPAGGGGTFLGGYIVKRWNMRCRGIVRLCMMCTVISLITIFTFVIHCPNMPMAGITAPYRSGLREERRQVQNQQLYDDPTELRRRNRSAVTAFTDGAEDGKCFLLSQFLFCLPHNRSSTLDENLTDGCNAACRCGPELYNPVCGADAMIYYSPCHAGCRSINHTEASTGKRVQRHVQAE